MEKIRIALVQARAAAAPAENRRRAIASVRAAARKGARIVCLQELFATPYFCRTEDRRWFASAETIPGPSTEVFCAAARENGVVLIVPIFEKRSRGLYHNSAAVIDSDGKLLGTYRKMHIPDDPGYYEKYYFAPGDTGFRTFKTRAGRIGVLICWDQWFPEAARLSTLGGADILFYPSAIGAPAREPKRSIETMRNAWRTSQIAHGIANGVFVASLNRAGREGKTVFWGSSFVSSPDGRVIASAGIAEKILYADCDLGLIAKTREEWRFLRDRRIDAYRDITKRFLA